MSALFQNWIIVFQTHENCCECFLFNVSCCYFLMHLVEKKCNIYNLRTIQLKKGSSWVHPNSNLKLQHFKYFRPFYIINAHPKKFDSFPLLGMKLVKCKLEMTLSLMHIWGKFLFYLKFKSNSIWEIWPWIIWQSSSHLRITS